MLSAALSATLATPSATLFSMTMTTRSQTSTSLGKRAQRSVQDEETAGHAQSTGHRSLEVKTKEDCLEEMADRWQGQPRTTSQIREYEAMQAIIDSHTPGNNRRESLA